MEKQTIVINPSDNVAVALTDLKEGEVYEGVTLLNDIPCGHKFALFDVAEGENVVKFGSPIARAMQDIPAGSHVHLHNAASALAGNLDYAFNKAEYAVSEVQPRTVNVYRHANGDVGIRNELWIIPLTGSLNGQAKLILKTFKNRYDTKGFDGVFVFTHPYGSSQTDEDAARTRAVLQKLVRHPNAGGVLILGLGYESNDIDSFSASLGGVDNNRIKFLNCQEVEDEIVQGVKYLADIAEILKNERREPADISCLKIGLKCGGSDGLSAVTANPLVGMFSDYEVAAGGTTVLTEVPEIFGAEQLLMNRAADEVIFDKIVGLVNDFKAYYRKNGRSVYCNPSSESVAAGITTLEEQSLSRTQKSGFAPVADVVYDNETVTVKGLNLLNAPCNDMCAVTSLAAAGCHLVLFTTGKGTPFGGCIPTIKISSNSALARKKSNWIDFNAGAVLENGYDAEMEKLINLVVAVANGKFTRNEVNGVREIAVLKTGVTL